MSIERSGNWNPGGGHWLALLPCLAVIGEPLTSSPSSYKLAEGYSWDTIYCTQETLDYDVKQTLTDNGTLYTHTITGYSPGDEAAKAAAMEKLTAQGRVLVRFADNAGPIRLIGLPTEGLEFTYSLTTDKDVAGSRGYTLSLVGTTTKPCQYD